MLLGNTSDDLAREDVKDGIQAGSPVTLVVMRPPLNLPGLERQHELRVIQRLDLSFFINRQHQGVVGWIQVKPDDIDYVVCKVRVVADLERFQPMRLEIGSSPHLRDLSGADPCVLGHQLQAPVGSLARHPLGRQQQDFLDLLLVELTRLSVAR